MKAISGHGRGALLDQAESSCPTASRGSLRRLLGTAVLCVHRPQGPSLSGTSCAHSGQAWPAGQMSPSPGIGGRLGVQGQRGGERAGGWQERRRGGRLQTPQEEARQQQWVVRVYRFQRARPLQPPGHPGPGAPQMNSMPSYLTLPILVSGSKRRPSSVKAMM